LATSKGSTAPHLASWRIKASLKAKSQRKEWNKDKDSGRQEEEEEEEEEEDDNQN
jgi:hypothetical protein